MLEIRQLLPVNYLKGWHSARQVSSMPGKSAPCQVSKDTRVKLNNMMYLSQRLHNNWGRAANQFCLLFLCRGQFSRPWHRTMLAMPAHIYIKTWLYTGYNTTSGNRTYIYKGTYDNWSVLTRLLRTNIILPRLMPVYKYCTKAMQTRYHTGWLITLNKFFIFLIYLLLLNIIRLHIN